MCLQPGPLSSPTDFFCWLLFSFPFADDHSRVRLQTIEGDTNSDYINGNYIDVCILKLSINPTVLHKPHCVSAVKQVDICWTNSRGKHINLGPHTTVFYPKHLASPFLRSAYWLVTSTVTFCVFFAIPCLCGLRKCCFRIFVNNLDCLTLKKNLFTY